MTLVLILLAGVIVAGLLYLSRLEGDFEVRRSILIAQPPHIVFQKICDFESWKDWSPWLIHEPEARLSFSPTPTEVGGWYRWDGERVGAGVITHVSQQADTAITQRIEFLRPFKSVSEVYWQFEPCADGTKTVWGMRGRMPFFLRFLTRGIVDQVGKDYALGLAMLRGCLDPTADRPRIHFHDPVELGEACYLCRHFSGTLDAMKEAMREGYPKLRQAARTNGFTVNGPMLALYRSFDETNRTTVCEMAIPVNEGIAPEGYSLQVLPPCTYLKVTVIGGYEFLEAAWAAALSHIRMRKLTFNTTKPSLEIYEVGPRQARSANELVTTLYLPVR